MSHISLRCTSCASLHPADMGTLRCQQCSSPLEVQYAAPSSSYLGQQPPGRDGPAMRLPLHDRDALVSLGEGHTPCVRLPALGGLLGLQQLYAKLESCNPTGSFKDRGTAVMISVAREHGVPELVENSSGNAGASVAAYAARAGIKASIFVPASAPHPKVQQIRVYGAEVHTVEGPREAATGAAVTYYTERSLVYASHNLSPYFIEGTKTFAYELFRQFAPSLPGHIVIPVGNGSLFLGAWRGLRELQEEGLITKMPRLHCIQARAVMPIAAAYSRGTWTPGTGARTIAGGIAVGAPPRKGHVLRALRATGGIALAVEDSEIVEWRDLLAKREGIYAELTAAAAFAGLNRLVQQGVVQPGELVVVPVTGSGLKDAPPS